MTVVTGQLRPGGAPYDGSLRLDVELDGVRLAYVDGGQIYTRRRPVDVDADGNFAVDLLPNDQIDPPGTVWMFTILPVSGFGRPDRFRVSVEDSDEPVDAHEILVPEPELLPSAAPAYQRTSERGVTYAALDELGRVLDAAGIPVGTDLAAVEAHAALTEGVHGIADTGALVLTTDDRLSDERSPTSHAASHGAAGEDPITVDASQLAGTIPVERLPADVIFQVSELLGLIAALQASWRTDDAALKDEVLEGLAGLSETIAALQALADDDTDVGTLLDAIGLK